jgi:hypothetical protein
MTVGEYSAAWSERQGHLPAGTAELYHYLLRDYVTPTFEHRRLAAITVSEVAA